MKVPPAKADAFVRRPPPEIRAVLVYGPDGGLVRERGNLAATSVLTDLTDPFRVAEMKSGEAAGDPARLYDEMGAIAMTGGRRLVRIRDADDGLTNALATLLKEPPPGDTLLVIEAGDLSKASKLRSLCEDQDRAAAVACYVEEEQALAGTIARLLGEHGLQIDNDARDWLAGNLVGDRAMARNEIDKLAIYMLGQKRVTLADVHAVIGDSASQEMDEPALAAADGDIPAVDRALQRLFGEGTSPVALLRSAQRHFQRLHQGVAMTAHGKTPQQAVKALRPPVFFKIENQVTGQLRRWTLPTLQQALARILEAEAEVKRTHIPDETVCARTFFQLAQLAKRRG